jgi:sec-independent protein translocase protein TatC
MPYEDRPMLFPTDRGQNSDDIFAESRMSFGDHIEELRKYLLRAIYGLLIALFGGLLLDYIGQQLDIPWLGVGRPTLKLIIEPAQKEMEDFLRRRNLRAGKVLEKASFTRINEIQRKLMEANGDTSVLTSEERRILKFESISVPVLLPVKSLEETFGIKAKDPNITEFEVELKITPAYLNYVNNIGESQLENRQFMKTQSAQEAMVVYFKVAILTSCILASPWMFFQLWAFIAAGLYPNERAYVYRFLGPSIVLFLCGVFLCQFVVLPGAVQALIGFNEWIDTDPDLRMNEWLSFALLLPLVFGISFQTPLVMFFFNRIGTFSWTDYWAKWRYAVMGLAVFSAIITPTPDVITMMYLFVPMLGLYMLGVAVCRFFPPAHEIADAASEAADQVAV